MQSKIPASAAAATGAMQSKTFLRLYLLAAVPMLIAMAAAVLVAKRLQLEKALPVVVCGIVFGGLVSAVKNSYRAGYLHGRGAQQRATSVPPSATDADQ